MSPFNQKLQAELLALAEKAEQLRQSLRQWHGPECICETGRICAFHATTNNHLVDIYDSAKAAARHLASEEV
jgi:hypothetical protein